MTIRINNIKVKNGVFTPSVIEDGLTLTVEASTFSIGGHSGSIDRSVITFTPSDVNKYVYAILVKRDGQYLYDLTIQDPSVLTPMGMAVNGEELFAFISGSILSDRLDIEVRHYSENEV